MGGYIMYRILIFFSLIIFSSQAAAPNSQILDYMSKNTGTGFNTATNFNDAANQREMDQANFYLDSRRSMADTEYRELQNDMMEQQIQHQKQLQQMQIENELLRRELESKSRKQYSEEKQHASQQADPSHSSGDCKVNCKNIGHKSGYCQRMCDSNAAAY